MGREQQARHAQVGIERVRMQRAAQRLGYSKVMTPTAQVGTYDYNWHWYNGPGCG